jgi:hypothetical protein
VVVAIPPQPVRANAETSKQRRGAEDLKSDMAGPFCSESENLSTKDALPQKRVGSLERN